MPATWKKLAYADDVPLLTLFGAHSILTANVANVAAGLTVGEQTFVGRITGGNIAALSPAQGRTLLNVIEGAGTLNVANATARAALTPTLGELVFQVDELAFYGCTVIA